jgi:hypothetical protein
MSEFGFATPASSTGIEWEALNGALLIVEPAETIRGISTNYGQTDAVRATVSVIDGPKAGEIYEDTLVFPKVLQSQLSSRIGRKVLGRLGQGVAKGNQSPPWKLEAGTTQDEATAVQWLASRTQLTAADLIPGQEPF